MGPNLARFMFFKGDSSDASQHTERQGHVRTQWEGLVYKLGREASLETNPDDILILHFQHVEL